MNPLFLEDQEYLLRVYRRLPITITKAKGVYLYDQERRYLDLYSGIAVNVLGHQHPLVQKSIAQQMKKYLHLSNYFVSDAVVNLAKLLVEHSFASKVFFGNSGAEVNEAALKLVKKYGKAIDPNKYEIIALEKSFHGRTIGGLSLTGQPEKKQMFEPLLPGIHHIKANDVQLLRATVTNRTCAIFLELIQGEAGIQPLNQEYLNEVMKLAKEYQFLVVVDEIQTGLMRTGSMFAYEQFSIVPDIVTLAKSLGGGLPLGAMLVSKALENVFEYGEHGSTFGGNPLACAAGLAVVNKLIDPIFQKTVHKKSKYLYNQIIDLQKQYPNIINDVRGLGMMIGIDLGPYAVKIQEAMMQRGILINITSKTIIRLLPPLIITKPELGVFIKAMKEILESIKGEIDGSN